MFIGVMLVLFNGVVDHTEVSFTAPSLAACEKHMALILADGHNVDVVKQYQDINADIGTLCYAGKMHGALKIVPPVTPAQLQAARPKTAI